MPAHLKITSLRLVAVTTDTEEVILEDYDEGVHARRGRNNGGSNAYDEDDEDGHPGHGPGGVQCQTQ